MQARAAAASHPRRILFIGDSLTYTNNLDERVAALARAAGVAWTSAAAEDGCSCGVVVEREVRAGAPLKKLWQETNARQIIADEGPWDVVVVQDDLPCSGGLGTVLTYIHLPLGSPSSLFALK